MNLYKLLTYASFLLILTGVSGFAGTMELEQINQYGVILSLLLILAGILSPRFFTATSRSVQKRKKVVGRLLTTAFLLSNICRGSVEISLFFRISRLLEHDNNCWFWSVQL